MIALWIILGIFALIALLLSLTLRVFLVLTPGGTLDIYAKYLLQYAPARNQTKS